MTSISIEIGKLIAPIIGAIVIYILITRNKKENDIK
jgi:hypothetical protein